MTGGSWRIAALICSAAWRIAAFPLVRLLCECVARIARKREQVQGAGAMKAKGRACGRERVEYR